MCELIKEYFITILYNLSVIGYFIIYSIFPESWVKYLCKYRLTTDMELFEYKTDFDKVLEFNKLFNVPKISDSNTREENYKIFRNGLDLILEEYKELKDALKDKDKLEVKDALCDLIYVIYGLFYRINMTSNEKLFNITCGLVLSFSWNPFHHYHELLQHCLYFKKNDIVYSQMFNMLMLNKPNLENYGEKLTKSYKQIEERYDLFAFYEMTRMCESLEQYINQIKDILDKMEKHNCTDFTFVYKPLALLLSNTYIYGMLKFDMDKNFNIVHESNMSKICVSEQEAIDTVKSYEERHVNGDMKYDSPYYAKISEDKWMVRNRSTEKVLKNINYKPVTEFPEWFDDLI